MQLPEGVVIAYLGLDVLTGTANVDDGRQHLCRQPCQNLASGRAITKQSGVHSHTLAGQSIAGSCEARRPWSQQMQCTTGMQPTQHAGTCTRPALGVTDERAASSHRASQSMLRGVHKRACQGREQGEQRDRVCTEAAGRRTLKPSGWKLAPSGVMYTPSGEMLMAAGATMAPTGALLMMQGA